MPKRQKKKIQSQIAEWVQSKDRLQTIMWSRFLFAVSTTWKVKVESLKEMHQENQVWGKTHVPDSILQVKEVNLTGQVYMKKANVKCKGECANGFNRSK